MIRYGFERGCGYFAIPTVPTLPKRVMVCVGRRDHTVTFNRLGGALLSTDVDVIEGREFTKLQTDEGLYCVSAASEADVSLAAEVISAIG